MAACDIVGSSIIVATATAAQRGETLHSTTDVEACRAAITFGICSTDSRAGRSHPEGDVPAAPIDFARST